MKASRTRTINVVVPPGRTDKTNRLRNKMKNKKSAVVSDKYHSVDAKKNAVVDFIRGVDAVGRIYIDAVIALFPGKTFLRATPTDDGRQHGHEYV